MADDLSPRIQEALQAIENASEELRAAAPEEQQAIAAKVAALLERLSTNGHTEPSLPKPSVSKRITTTRSRTWQRIMQRSNSVQFALLATMTY